MKKSMLALGLASALAASAAAQAEAEVYGILDVNVTRVGGDAQNTTLLATGNGTSVSMLGFRGSEDLGGGLSVVFNIAGRLFNDQPSAAGTDLKFERVSIVGLAGGFGQVTAGRQLTPLLFAIIGVDNHIETYSGSPLNLGIQAFSSIRNDNSIMYTSPAMGGFLVRAIYTFGEQPGSNTLGRQVGLSAHYTAGPIGAHLGYHSAEPTVAGDSLDETFAGATYTLPNKIKLGLGFATHEQGTTVDYDNILVTATIPVGPHTFLPAYLTFDNNVSGSSAESTQLALAYTYALSKTTNLYASWADIDNENGATSRTFGAILNGIANGTTEYNFGIRKVF